MRSLLSAKEIFRISDMTYGTQARGFSSPALFEREDGLVAADEVDAFDVKKEGIDVGEEEAFDVDFVMVD